jgi:hypothetical protein
MENHALRLTEHHRLLFTCVALRGPSLATTKSPHTAALQPFDISVEAELTLRG